MQRYGMGQAPGVNNPMLPMGVEGDPNVIATDFYNYSVFFTNLAPNTSATTSLQIEADSDFEIVKLQQFTISDAAEATPQISTNQVPDVTVLLTDTGSGRQLMNIALPISNIFGSGTLPFILPRTKRLFARSTLSVQVTNLNTADTYAYIYLTFSGKKIFTRGQ